MQNIKNKAIDKLLYTEDSYTQEYRDKTSLNFNETVDDQKISLALVAYLENKLKLDNGNLALGMSTLTNPHILALELDINEKDRVGVSISHIGAIYGLWFKKDNIYVNSSISVGASFRESIALVGLLIEASLHFSDNKDEIQTTYQNIKENLDQDLSDDLLSLNNQVRDFASDFVWLNNVGEISYRELYIASLPYTSSINQVLEHKDNFILYPRTR